jgi:hypothetical protein
VKIAIYDKLSGLIVRRVVAPESAIDIQAETGTEFFLNCPENSTHIFAGTPTVVVPLPPPPPAPDEIISQLTTAMEAHYDSVARSNRYYNRTTCLVRAGYPGPYHADGQTFGTWMDTCVQYGYQVEIDAKAGRRAIPTAEQLISELPLMVWPV